MNRILSHLIYASYVFGLFFAMVSIYLGSVLSCVGETIPANRWLIAFGSLELFLLAGIAVAHFVVWLIDSTKSEAYVVIDLVYIPVRIILGGIGLAALPCVAAFPTVVVMLVYLALTCTRAILLLLQFCAAKTETAQT